MKNWTYIRRWTFFLRPAYNHITNKTFLNKKLEGQSDTAMKLAHLHLMNSPIQKPRKACNKRIFSLVEGNTSHFRTKTRSKCLINVPMSSLLALTRCLQTIMANERCYITPFRPYLMICHCFLYLSQLAKTKQKCCHELPTEDSAFIN